MLLPHGLQTRAQEVSLKHRGKLHLEGARALGPESALLARGVVQPPPLEAFKSCLDALLLKLLLVWLC